MVEAVQPTWGIATIQHGVTIGVSGHMRFRSRAERKVNRLNANVDVAEPSVRRYQVVSRTRRSNADWGARPTPPPARGRSASGRLTRGRSAGERRVTDGAAAGVESPVG
jgi:hypothetical protein